MVMDWQPDYYDDKGCCLTCDEEIKEINALDEGGCLCRNCLCRQCYWYEPDYGDFEVSDGGSCTYPRNKYLSSKDILKMKWVIVRGVPNSITIEKDNCRVVNDNGFGLLMIIDKINKKMVQIDSYNLEYYGI